MSSNIYISNSRTDPQNAAASERFHSDLNEVNTQKNYYAVYLKPSQRQEAQRLAPSYARPSNREGFQIAVICALPLEYDAVALLFDEFWDEDGERYGRAVGDFNTCTTGRIGNYNVVMTLLPNTGKVTAAGAATGLRLSYPRLELALFVGICSGVPGTGADGALLGDVVISKTAIQFDFGRQYSAEFVTRDTFEDSLVRPNKDIRGLIASLGTELGKERLQRKAGEYLKDLQEAAARKKRQHSYQYLGVTEDKLFAATYGHRHRVPQSCEICNREDDLYCAEAAQASCVELNCNEYQPAPERTERLEVKGGLSKEDMQCPGILIGHVATGDMLMRSGTHRDQFAKKLNVIAFDVGGAGIWDELPSIIIKGVCDYGDSHNNREWRPFAAATAASVMKAILGRYAPTDISLPTATYQPGELSDSLLLA